MVWVRDESLRWRGPSTATLVMSSFVSLLAIVFSGAQARSETGCTVADTVRFSLNDTVYRIPVSLQPWFSPDNALATQDYFPAGVRATKYCQSPQDPSSRVQSVGFPKQILIDIAQRNADYVLLARVFPLSIRHTYAPLPEIPDGGQLISNGAFRGIVRGERSEIISVDAIFFNQRIVATCIPAGEPRPSKHCAILARLPGGSNVNVGFVDIDSPIRTWPELLHQVRVFISSLANPPSDGRRSSSRSSLQISRFI